MGEFDEKCCKPVDPVRSGVRLLQEAMDTINQRGPQYGSPNANFENIAGYWNTYLRSMGLLSDEMPGLAAADVAAMNMLQKVGRMATSFAKRDHWVDIAGYSACGWECVNETGDKDA